MPWLAINPKTLRMKGKLHNHELTILDDRGSTHNFKDVHFRLWLVMGTRFYVKTNAKMYLYHSASIHSTSTFIIYLLVEHINYGHSVVKNFGTYNHWLLDPYNGI